MLYILCVSARVSHLTLAEFVDKPKDSHGTWHNDKVYKRHTRTTHTLKSFYAYINILFIFASTLNLIK